MSHINIKVFSSSDLGFFVNSTIVYGKKDAILFDAQLLQSEAQKVVDIIKNLDRQLKTIFISHAHADHYFGLETFLRAFPDVKIYAHSSVVADARKTTDHQIIGMKQLYQELIPDSIPIPEPYDDLTFRIEEDDIQIIPNLAGDIAPSTAYFIPSVQTMIAGDVVFNNIHPWTVDTNNKEREQWIDSLEKLKSFNPQVVVSGHKDINQPDSPSSLNFMINYLTEFNRAIKSFTNSHDVIKHMRQKFPEAKKTGILNIGAKKNKAENFSFKDFFED
ncbi:MBL fold metallo-hydrolase [Fulvivirga lutea]|uniref:MBL fold metallo-hydrolase n=1 Tax=Fulvivirga lutea TaxID=2810512 RepID=A0A974WIZ4_9BACT|nr:MBL fold metallo-hydrolase [Fulvivirga lutea]QSE97025.1 MBL fold metallo-hydrolase [Fulvivirga lutea]